jgi:hypothetical protein
MRRISRLVAVAAAIAGTSVPATTAAASAPIEIQFDKTFSLEATIATGTPTWTGTASGAAVGEVEIRLVSFSETGPITHLVSEWRVRAGGRSFTARVEGIYNQNSQIVVLNGVVTSGWQSGAQIHERGIRPDLSVSRYVGTLTLVGGER